MLFASSFCSFLGQCDERLPSCGYCNLRGIPCNYVPALYQKETDNSESFNTLVVRPRTPSSPDDTLTPSAPSSLHLEEDLALLSIIPNPSTSVISAAGTLYVADLRLLQHWSTSTFRSIFVGGTAQMDRILRHQIPDLAFRNGFLMQGLLGAASLHAQRILPDPQRLRKRTDVYRARALHTFRQALDNAVPDTDTYDAALMMSLLLVISLLAGTT